MSNPRRQPEPANSLVYTSPGSVADTDTEYRGISKYRYRCRYSKYRKIPNTEEKISKKTINQYFNFVNKTPSWSQFTSVLNFWWPTQPDWIISTICLFTNFTQNRYDYSVIPVVTRNISALNLLKFLFRPSRFRPVLSCDVISSLCQRARFSAFSCVNF